MSSFATVYPILADRLAAEVPGLGWIDLDQDQLTPDGQLQEYALPFHAGVVLIDFDEADWRDIGEGIQRGDAVVRVTLAVQVVADSYQHSTQRSQALEKLERLDDIHRALQHFDGGGHFGALVRTYSRKEQSELPGIWQHSMGYKVLLTDTEGYTGATQTVSGLEPAARGEFVLP